MTQPSEPTEPQIAALRSARATSELMKNLRAVSGVSDYTAKFGATSELAKNLRAVSGVSDYTAKFGATSELAKSFANMATAGYLDKSFNSVGAKVTLAQAFADVSAASTFEKSFTTFGAGITLSETLANLDAASRIDKTLADIDVGVEFTELIADLDLTDDVDQTQSTLSEAERRAIAAYLSVLALSLLFTFWIYYPKAFGVTITASTLVGAAVKIGAAAYRRLPGSAA